MMKTKLLLTLLALANLSSTNALAGHYAPAADQPGSTAVAMTDAAITSWATGVVDYQAGLNVDATWQTPLKALGPAVGNSFDIVSLGAGGQITLSFADPIANGAGFDFAVFENSITDTFLELAKVEVSSDGANFFAFPVFSETAAPVGPFGSVDATNIDGLAGKYRQGFGTPFDLATLSGLAGLDINAVSYVRLLDVVGDGSMFDDTPVSAGGPNPIYDPYQTFGSAGFDLDAIGVMNSASTVIPVPAAFWLFFSGLAGLAVFRQKKSI